MGYATYYGVGLPTFVIIIIALYLLFTGAFLVNVVLSEGDDADGISLTQTLAKHSMLGGSWKRQVHMRGLERVSDCVSD